MLGVHFLGGAILDSLSLACALGVNFMKLDTHWLIESVGHKPSERSVVLPVSEIVSLAYKMKEGDTIYAYHLKLPLDRIALEETNTGNVTVVIHGHGGGLEKTVSLSNLESMLENFEKIQKKSEEYGFKPDWE